jgi:hypothetical protein
MRFPKMRVPQIIQVDHFSIKTHGDMGESMCILWPSFNGQFHSWKYLPYCVSQNSEITSWRSYPRVISQFAMA